MALSGRVPGAMKNGESRNDPQVVSRRDSICGRISCTRYQLAWHTGRHTDVNVCRNVAGSDVLEGDY
jgi:hypothetical protein